jgi:dihydrofolate synthase/folylpolyglutamate synthase
LGHTIAEIAGEKAGIMKVNTPVVFSDVVEEATEVFYEKGKKMSAPCYPVSKKDYTFLKFKNKSIDFSYVSRYDYNVKIHLNTLAKYQMENCTLALRAIEVLDAKREILPKVLAKGVEQTFWPGRMEEVLPEIFVDGAHNADGVRAFLETVREDAFEGKRSLLFSVVSDKDYAQMLRKIAESGLFHKIYLAQMGNYRATSLEEMKHHLPKSYKGEVVLFDSVKAAFEEVKVKKLKDERVYIVGSLYLVGEIKEYVNDDKF